MPPLPPTSRTDQRRQTEERILAAARRMFAETGYDRTTIRAIAAAAGVDGGLVMHYFGSKESLFLQCTKGEPQAPPAGASPAALTEFLMLAFEESLTKDPVGQAALFRSMLTHPDAADTVRASVAMYLDPIIGAIEADQPELRANLVGAIILGIAVGRLLKIGDLAQASPRQLTELLRPSIEALVNGSVENRG